MSYNVAVVGSTGRVGKELLKILGEKEKTLPIKNIIALASKSSKGKKLSCGKKELIVQDLNTFDFNGIDIAFFSAGAAISERFVPLATAKGCIVIDNTSFFRMDNDVPLIIPEINSKDIFLYKNRNIIANPNCSTIQMLLVLHPLHKIAKIKRIVVSTYQSVSGAGQKAMDELFDQTKKSFFVYDTPSRPKEFTKRIAFNCIPHIDIFMDDGSTKEEWKMSVETHKILDPSIKVSATCVRVPVFISHSESVNVEFYNPITEDEAFEVLHETDGVLVVDRREDGGYITPIDAVQDDNVYVSRLRKDYTIDNGLNLWIVGDNIRKGAALNAIQIAERLFEII